MHASKQALSRSANGMKQGKRESVKAPCDSDVTGALILVGILKLSDASVTPHFTQHALWKMER